MKIHSIPFADITIAPDRQRREFDSDRLLELSESIWQVGLIHPVVVRMVEGKPVLVAGERRMRALEYLWISGRRLRCGTAEYPQDTVPCLLLGDIPPLQAMEIELEENIKRQDLTWQEHAQAVERLVAFRTEQAKQTQAPVPTNKSIGEELYPEQDAEWGRTLIRRNLMLARNLDDPEVAAAKTAKEAVKILERKEVAKENTRRGLAVGTSLQQSRYTLLIGDCLEVMSTLPPQSFDVILTDPPYGMDAQDFGDSSGKTPGAHFYDDSIDTWRRLMHNLGRISMAVCKPMAHLYVFCDIDNFIELRSIMAASGWHVFRTPIIWTNPTAMRAPWPDGGPQRKYQLCLYARRGGKPVNSLVGDVITCASDPNQGHHAQKPVGLYTDLLKRSCRPGDYVLDPFCGSGPIFPAAAGLNLYATGIEIEPRAAGIAAKRIEVLK